MLATYVAQAIKEIPILEQLGEQVSSALHQAVLSGGDPARTVADALHGVWLGHPLHSAMTDIPVGAWTLSVLFDAIASTGSQQAETVADHLLAAGSIAAVPTALAGMADYSTIPQSATAMGALHGTLNAAGLTLCLLSLWERKRGHRARGVAYSSMAFGLTLFSAWLGGEMVYKQRVGVNHAEQATKPKKWTAIMSEKELPEGTPTRIDVEGTAVLLYRHGGTVYAIGAVCAHAGGPLEKGSFDGLCVQCPWHDSVFDLRDGSVVHGPATYPQPDYAARIHKGHIEIRLQRPEEHA